MFKNCVLITIDSLRADHLGCYGYKEIETPNIDELAENGIVFTNSYANSPGTPSSFLAILTSTYPMMYGGYGKLSKSRPYLPEILKRKDNKKIYTIGINSNPYLSRYFGYHRGFDLFYEMYDNISSTNTKINLIVEKGIKFIHTLLGVPPYITGYVLNKIAKAQIEKVKDRPFFMWIHYMDVHVPYVYKSKFKNILYRKKIKELNKIVIEVSRGQNREVPEGTLSEIIELYDEGIQRVDDIIGDLLKFLRKCGLVENTLVILTADHGEEFMEHGGLCHMPKLYDELLHIPLILYNPSLKRKYIDSIVDQLDIAPTISNALDAITDSKWLGKSLLTKTKIKDKVISEVSNTVTSAKVNRKEWRISVRTRKWKLHFILKNNRVELYDLSNDPLEQKNLVDKKKRVAKVLMEVVNTHISHVQRTNFADKKFKKVIEKLKLKAKI